MLRDGPVGGFLSADGPRGGDLGAGGDRRSAAGCLGASRMGTSRSREGTSLIGTSRPDGAEVALFLGDKAGESGRDLTSRARMLPGRGELRRETGCEVTAEELSESLGSGEGRRKGELRNRPSLRSGVRDLGRYEPPRGPDGGDRLMGERGRTSLSLSMGDLDRRL